MANYYEILGVDKNASDEDIKKAFREKAKNLHPDTTTDTDKKKELEEKFKEVNKAYQILSDPQERAAYDNPRPQGMPHGFNFGGNPFGGMHGGFGINLDEVFNRMANGGGQHFSFNTTTQMTQEVNINLLDVILENEITIPTQFGKMIKFKVPPEFKSGGIFKVRINDDRNPNNITIINMKMNVVIPKLSLQQKEQIVKILT
jgi:DnaJ-class molecular chaperone